MTNVYDNFALPIEAVQDLQGIKTRETRLGDGVSMVEVARDIVPHRWVRIQVKNEVKSKAAKFPIKDDVIMCEWIIDKKNHPSEQAKFLPDELLAFDDYGDPVGGAYLESYNRFLQGLAAPGLPLNRWGVLSDAQVSSLADFGIFTVEDFASQPRARITGKFPVDYQEAFLEAIDYVQSRDSRTQSDKLANELAEQRMTNEQMMKTIQELQAKVNGYMQGSDIKRKKAGRPRKIQPED